MYKFKHTHTELRSSIHTSEITELYVELIVKAGFMYNPNVSFAGVCEIEKFEILRFPNGSLFLYGWLSNPDRVYRLLGLPNYTKQPLNEFQQNIPQLYPVFLRFSLLTGG